MGEDFPYSKYGLLNDGGNAVVNVDFGWPVGVRHVAGIEFGDSPHSKFCRLLLAGRPVVFQCVFSWMPCFWMIL